MKRNKQGKFEVKHGMSFTSEYRSWVSMKNRCLNPDEKHEKYRDMYICKEWLNSFECFIKDMGVKPTNKHTIDRIDNSKGYFPENCRWATRSEQNRNYSLNKILKCRGKEMCVTEWAEYLNIPRHRIFNRLNIGWEIERALFKDIDML